MKEEAIAIILEEPAPSFFENPLGWLLNKAAEIGRENREAVDERAKQSASQKMESYLIKHPEFAAKAKSAADFGLANGIISPKTYEMLQDVETTHNHTPAPDVSASVDSPMMGKGQASIRF